jgi:hypothetical protein
VKKPSIIWIPIGLAAASAFIVLITLFGVFNAPIKSVIESRLSESVGSRVTIESLDGNPFYEFSLSRVEVTDSGHTIFACGEAVVSYRPISLLWGNLVVDSLRLVSPRLRLSGKNRWYDSVWSNIPSFDLRSIVVERGIISVDDSTGNAAVDNLDLELGFRYLAGEMALQVRRLKTVVMDPPLEISNLTGLVLTRDDVLLVEGVQLSTAKSSITIDGQVTGLSDPHFRFEVGSDSLNLDEVGIVAGIDLPLTTAWFSARLEGSLAEYEVELDWVVGGAAGDAGLRVITGEFPTHNLDIHGREVDLSALAGLPLRGDFELVAKGEGVSLAQATGTARATISKGTLYGIPVDSVVSRVRYSDGQAKGELSLDSAIGGFTGEMTLSPESFDLSGQLSSVDLKHADGPPTDLEGKLFASVDSLTARLRVDLDRVLIDGRDGGNLSASFDRSDSTFALTSLRWIGQDENFRVNGRGDLWRQEEGLFSLAFDGTVNPAASLDWTSGPTDGPIHFSTKLWSEPLKFGETQKLMTLSASLGGFFGLDTLDVAASANGGRISIEQFEGTGQGASLTVNGEMIFESAFDLEATYSVADVSVIPNDLRHGATGTGLRISAGMVGPWETPEIGMEGKADILMLAGSVFEGLTIDSKIPTAGEGGISLQSELASWGGRKLNGFYADVGSVGDEVSFLVGNREGSDNRVAIWGVATTFPESLSVRVDSAHIQFKDEFVVNRGPIALSHSPESGISVHQLHLVGPSGELEAASLGPGGAIDVRVHEFDIAPWAFLVGLDDRIEGTLSGGLAIEGLGGDLTTTANFQVVEARIDSFRADTIYSEVSYQGTQALGKLGAKALSGDLWVEGTITLDKDDPDREVDLRILADRFPLTTVDGFWTQVTDIAGTLSGEVWLSGPANAVSPRGEFSVDDGRMTVPSLNRGLTGIDLEVLVSPGQITVTRFEGSGSTGKLDAIGQAELLLLNLDRLDDPLLGALDLRLTATDLDVSGTPDIQAVINGSVDLSGMLSSPVLVGALAIQKAELRLLSMLEAPSDPESIWLTVPFFENLQCELQLSAERQLWIKDGTVNIEVFGDVDVLRNLDDVTERRSAELGFRFFGAMQSLRGTYRFQNRNFRIDQDVENVVSFQGERPVDPTMRIQAMARIPTFSPSGTGGDTRQVQDISVLVSGSFAQPTILLREGSGIDLFGEAEVVSSDEQARYLSYILFGRAPEDLIAAEQNLLGERSAGLVLGMATRALQSRIADRLNLDVVQVEMGSASSISRVSVGKYINDRLFVTYEDQIGQRREFTVEYELLPRFSLESTAVVDPNNDVAPSLRLTWSKDW